MLKITIIFRNSAANKIGMKSHSSSFEWQVLFSSYPIDPQIKNMRDTIILVNIDME
jgi:hypothetical protein